MQPYVDKNVTVQSVQFTKMYGRCQKSKYVNQNVNQIVRLDGLCRRHIQSYNHMFSMIITIHYFIIQKQQYHNLVIWLFATFQENVISLQNVAICDT